MLLSWPTYFLATSSWGRPSLHFRVVQAAMETHTLLAMAETEARCPGFASA